MFKLYSVLFFCASALRHAASQSVIVVGAGASGIAVASKLLENGINNVTILEAEGRIGGRVYSVQFGKTIEDLGAEWCHGENGNIVYELVKDLNILKSPNRNEIYRYSFPNDHENLMQDLNVILDDIFINSTADVEGISLGDHIIKEYKAKIAELNYDSSEKQVAEDFLHMYSKEVLWDEGALSWFSPSAVSDYELCEGNQYLSWGGKGFKTILDVVTKKYPNINEALPVESKIKFRKEVVRIEWNNDKAIVKCLDGSEYFGDHVVFTPSLGVLKAQHTTLFYPPLPQNKVNAIETLGMGAVEKVFLHFSKTIWPATNLFFCWTEEERSNLLNEFPLGPSQNGRSWLESFYGILVTKRNPNVMVAWFMGEFVPVIELIHDNVLIDGIMFVLNRFFPEQSINLPDRILRSKWYSNPHFKGTYSYQTIESRKCNVSGEVVLSEPLSSKSGKKTLMFAGEATSTHHFSTVHGAIESGYREADRIINIYG